METERGVCVCNRPCVCVCNRPWTAVCVGGGEVGAIGERA